MPGLTLIDTNAVPSDLPFWISAYGMVSSMTPLPGTAVTVGYALRTGGFHPYGNAYRGLTTAEETTITDAFAAIAANTGLTFVEVPLAQADIQIGASSDVVPNVDAYTWAARHEPVQIIAFDYMYPTSDGLAENPYVFLHNLLHGVGLNHSTPRYGTTSSTIIPTSFDNATTLFGQWEAAFDDAPQMFDLAALQFLYGPDTAQRTGDDTYTGQYAAYVAGQPNAQDPMIWDGGGYDTLDLSAASGPVNASLKPGAISQNNTSSTHLLEAGTFTINHFTVIERLIGSAYNDILIGGDHASTLVGGAGNDQITGGAGGDWITPGIGSDIIDGMGGIDMLSLVDLPQAAVVDLDAQTANSGSDLDSFFGIENVTATIYGDYIVGDEGANRIRALGDYDWMVGAGGGDQFEGGTGRDMVSYVNADGAVLVHLGAGYGAGDQATGDTYIDVERATGSRFNDTFYGSNGEDDFRGLAGNDVFFGSAGGKDRYYGGDGFDVVSYTTAPSGVIASLLLGRGSAGDAARDLYFDIEALYGSGSDDILTGNNTGNTLLGGGGDDTLIGNGGANLLNGGAGTDRAEFTNTLQADAQIDTTGPNATVTRGGVTSTLIDIEVIGFADGDVLL